VRILRAHLHVLLRALHVLHVTSRLSSVVGSKALTSYQLAVLRQLGGADRYRYAAAASGDRPGSRGGPRQGVFTRHDRGARRVTDEKV
jgi:hypothetical protein